MRLVLCSLLLLAACGDDGGDDTTPTPDASLAADSGNSGCIPGTILPANWRLIDTVSNGMVSAVGDELTIDATAGGVSAAADNPYVYVNLDSGSKVAVTDVEALTDTTWDIGLKRAGFKVNGGDSGSGGRSAARVAAGSLAEVTQLPADGAFATDDWASADCMFVSLPGGEPAGVLADWYDYDDATHVLTPKAEVYVIKRDASHAWKLRIETYYGDPSSPMRGGIYKVQWQSL